MLKCANADIQLRGLHSRSSVELRSRFLQFFESQGHRVVRCASLVPPESDSSLLFVNVSMCHLNRTSWEIGTRLIESYFVTVLSASRRQAQ